IRLYFEHSKLHDAIHLAVVQISVQSFFFYFEGTAHLRYLHSFPTRRSSDLFVLTLAFRASKIWSLMPSLAKPSIRAVVTPRKGRSEEHTSELQSQSNLVCRLLLEKKKTERSSA